MDYEKPLFFQVMAYAAATEGDVIDMVSGNPDWGSPDAISEGLVEYAGMDGEAFQYAPADGLPHLREQVAAQYDVDVEAVIITNGAGEANYLGMGRAIERGAGDEVILTDPVYPYYPGKVGMLGGTQTFVPVTESGSIDPAGVREAASEETACIVINSPNNPIGSVYDAETIEELVAIAEEYDAILVSDEVYDEFVYTDEYASALDHDSSHRIVTGSYSKSFAITGFRVGFAIAPPEHADALRKRHMLTNVSVSRPAQYAVSKALDAVDPAYFEANRELVQERIATFTSALDEAGAEYNEPDGAFYVMVRFPGFEGTLENVYRLIDEAGVAGMPGSGFGSSREEWIRFALVTPRVEEAANRLVEYFG